MFKPVLAFAFALLPALTQDSGPPNPANTSSGSIRGMVKDESTGSPIPDAIVTVYVNAQPGGSGRREVKVLTDPQGHYRLSDLPPNRHRVFARSKDPLGPHAEKIVNVRAGQEVGSVDFLFPSYGAIAGRIVDQNEEPLAGITVCLLSKEYSYGGVSYLFKRVTTTDDQGGYVLQGFEPGFPFTVMAYKRGQRLGYSDAPADRKLRKPAFQPTYYPNVAEPQGAAPIVLRPGERRDNMDIRLLRVPAYCIEGVVGGGSAPGRFMIAGDDYNAGIASGGGVSMVPPGGTARADGKFRVCDLRRGTYRLSSYFEPPGTNSGPTQWATAQVNIADEDVTNVKLNPVDGIPISGTVDWWEAPPAQPIAAQLSVSLRPANRMSFMGENHFIRASVPGEFSFPRVLMDDYHINASINAPGVYVKDIVYGTKSVLHSPFRAGTASGDLRVLLGHDGGSLAVRVADKDGNPVPDLHVAIIPVETPSEAALPESLIVGDTDQDGNFTQAALPPGKYLILATFMKLDRTVERVSRLWRARSHAKTIEIGPKGSVSVTLEPLRID